MPTKTTNQAANDDDGAHLFTSALRESMEALRSRVSDAVGYPVGLHFGPDDQDLSHWACLVIDETGSHLVTIVVGPKVPGFAAVISADNMRELCQITKPEHLATGLQVAEAEAVREFRELVQRGKLA